MTEVCDTRPGDSREIRETEELCPNCRTKLQTRHANQLVTFFWCSTCQRGFRRNFQKSESALDLEPIQILA